MNIIPDEPMDVVLVEASGVGPDAQTFNVSSDGSDIQVDDLLAGLWTIDATGKNALGTVIATGQATPTLIIGVTTPVTITLVEDAG